MPVTFGEHLRDVRRQAGISQRELANRASLDFTYISKLENDRLPAPAADTVLALANAVGVPPEELLALTGKIPTAVQQAVSRSAHAQRFLRDVEQMHLSDDEWKAIRTSLKGLRRQSRRHGT